MKYNKIFFIGELIMILGSVVYGIELIIGERNSFSHVVLGIYAVALVAMLVGRIKAGKQPKTKTGA